jgi:periplasmic copper chaperone A
LRLCAGEKSVLDAKGNIMRILMPIAAACALTAISIITAHAHASLEKREASPGSYKAVLKIPHGCDGQATHTVRLQIPEGYIGVKPMPKPGWTIATAKGDYARKYDLHGEEVASGVTEVTWSGGELPDDFYDEFTVSGTLAGVEAGQTLFFKATQLCADGEVAWTEEPTEGQDPHSLEYPAPMLKIAAAGGGHEGHGAHGDAPVAIGDLEISGQWARAMLPGQPAGGGYMTISNKGSEPDRLVSITSAAAGRAEIHSMEVVDGVMVMRPAAGGLEIPAGATVELKPGGLHLMFMEVAERFEEGASVPLTLEFEKAGKVDLTLPVKAASGGGDHSNH